MTTKSPTPLAAALTAFSLLLCGGCSRTPSTQDELIAAAVSPDETRAAAARAGLRAQGQAGLDALLAGHEDLIATCHRDPPIEDSPCDAEAWSRVRAAVETVAQQRDASRSGLYWFTDLEEAKTESARTGNPILSLRLLGGLNQEYTCANSRFFRTVLYANASLSQAMRGNFVLHWEAVRPVPKVTIDFGDGRSLKTTLTGNSAHYVLTSTGTPIEVMPGLVGATRFAGWLAASATLADQLAAAPEPERPDILAAHHRNALEALERELAGDLAAVAEEQPSEAQPPEAAFSPTGNGDDIVFRTGSFITYPDGTKANIELPIAQGLLPDTEALEQWFGRSIWNAVAERHVERVVLDQRSRDLARWKTRRDADDMAPLFERLQRSVAEEQVRTEYVAHRAVHRWFVRGEVTDDLEALTARLYRDVFGLPTNDAWLGLVPDADYRALDDDGLSG